MQLGVYAFDAKNGIAQFSDIEFATGNDAIKNVAINDNSEWEIFTDKDGNFSNTGKSMEANGGDRTVIANDGLKGHGYIYGVDVKADEPQQLTTTITLETKADTYSSHGIVIEYNNGTEKESVQFYMEGTRKQIRIISDYNWDPSTRADLSETVYDVNGACDVTATVKDGMLYLAYGDKASYKVSLDTLFPDTFNKAGTIRFGVCSLDILSGSTNRRATFSDVKFVKGEKAELDTTKTYKTIEYLAGAGANYNVNDGVVSKSSDSNALWMNIKGASTTWEVSGTFNRTDTSTNKDLLAGFRISDANGKALNIIGSGTGLSFIEAGTNHWCMHYKNVENKWTVNKIPSNIFANPWSDKSIDFRAVIADDIFYVWFDEILVWRIDLSEAIECTNTAHNGRNSVVSEAFAEDTSYNFGFYMAGNAQKGTFSNLKIKTGDEVTSQSKFITDRNNVNYNFADGIAAVEAKVAAYRSFMEKATATDMIYDALIGDYTPTANVKSSYIYGDATAEPQVMRAKITVLDKANNKAQHGITVQYTNAANTKKSAQILLQGSNEKVRLMYDHTWLDFNISSWITTPVVNSDGLCDVTAVVKNETLYILYNNVLAGSVDLYKLLPGYQEGGAVQLGVNAYDAMENSLARYSDITFATGADAVNAIAVNDSCEWEIFTDVAGVFAHKGQTMSGDGKNHTCTPDANKAGANVIYGAATNMPQMLSTNVTLIEGKKDGKSVYSSNGISIAYGNQSVEFYIEGTRDFIRILEDRGWKNKKDDGYGANLTPDSNGTYHLTAIVKNGWLYINWDDTAKCKFEITKLFKNYQPTDLIRLGTAVYDTQNGRSANLTNVNFSAGEDVTVNASVYTKTIDWTSQD